MARFKVEVDEALLKKLVIDHLCGRLGGVHLDEKKVVFQVMTKENYRAKEWENGAFRATYEGEI